MDKIGKTMWLIFWCIVLGALAYYFQGEIAQKINPNQLVSSSLDNQGRISVVLKPNRSGHYLVKATINDIPVTLLLDTGATQISIPAHLAKKLRLKHGRRFDVNTANGRVEVAATTIDSLAIGEITLRSLDANLNPGMTDDTILLGMNALKQLELHQRNDRLTLTLP